jgi:hypothetical protein
VIGALANNIEVLMSELIDNINLDAFSATYAGYKVEYLPYETLETLMEEYPEMADWDLRSIIHKIDKQLTKYSLYDEDKGFRLDKGFRRIKIDGSMRHVRPLYYFLMTGVYPNRAYVLHAPDDNPHTLDIDRLKLVDRRKVTKEASEKYRERMRKLKESVGVMNE